MLPLCAQAWLILSVAGLRLAGVLGFGGQGVDIIYESVGGDMLKICLGALAKKGRLIVIGMMSQYSSGWQPSQVRSLRTLR